MQHLSRQTVTDASDSAARAAIDEAVEDLRIHTGHQHKGVICAGDVLGGVAEGISSTEFLEANKV